MVLKNIENQENPRNPRIPGGAAPCTGSTAWTPALFHYSAGPSLGLWAMWSAPGLQGRRPELLYKKFTTKEHNSLPARVLKGKSRKS